MKISSNVVILILIIKVLSASYPNCSDPSTYNSYGKSTEYKGLNEHTPWDRVRNTSDQCNLTNFVQPPMPKTCGDCDFEVPEQKWFRFDEGPYVKIAEFPDNTTCPIRGHCNGFHQIVLVPSNKTTDNPNSKNYEILFSDLAKTTCTQYPSLVESFDCGEFILYKFPSSWNSLSASWCTSDIVGQPTPYSLCMDDTVIDLTLTANRKYFTKEDDYPLICNSTRSPTPPKIIWIDQDGSDMTTKATRDTQQSSLFTAVYSLNFSSTYTSVTCQVDDKSHTFYQVSIEARNVTGIAGNEVTATCSVNLDKLSPEDEKDLYLIEVLDGPEVYYTTENVSSTKGKMEIDKQGSGTYLLTLLLANTSIPANAKNKTENWKCGVRDPITKLYTTTPFSVTIKRRDTINMKYIIASAVGALLVILLLIVGCVLYKKRSSEPTSNETITMTKGLS